MKNAIWLASLPHAGGLTGPTRSELEQAERPSHTGEGIGGARDRSPWVKDVAEG